jgi:MFS family permease
MASQADSRIEADLKWHDTTQDTVHDLQNSDDDDHVDTRFQPGVQDIEAVTIAWSRTWLIIAYILIWITYFVQGLVSGVSGSLLPYVTSAFAEHSLTPTTNILSAVIGGVTNLSIAKVLDIFGRPQGYLLCIVLCVIGLIMSATCNNVEAYAASQVFYTVGINGIGYSLSVFVADTSSLRHRGLMQAFVNSPNLITCWLAGPISTAFLNGPGWRWAFGMFTILVPVVTLPLSGLFMWQFVKAKKLGLIPKHDSGRTPLQSIIHYSREFDAIGLLLISAGVAFFLLPFNIYTIEAKGWGSSLIICFLVFGIVVIIAFALWEKIFAPISFIPWSLLQDRTVLGACLLSFTLFLSYACWASYFTSVLQIVNDLSITDASYVMQTYTVGGVLTSLATGGVISYTGRYKPIAIYFGIPMTVLGMGLLIYFRQPDRSVGYIVMCMIFISFAEGVLVICDEIAIMAAAAEQQYFAVSLAVLGLFGNIGTAIGLTISAAIWQGILPNKLAEYLPAVDQSDLLLIYESLTTQLSFLPGTPERLAIQHAYGDAQRGLLIAGTAVWAIGLVGVLMWRDIKVIGIKQTKGQVA